MVVNRGLPIKHHLGYFVFQLLSILFSWKIARVRRIWLTGCKRPHHRTNLHSWCINPIEPLTLRANRCSPVTCRALLKGPLTSSAVAKVGKEIEACKEQRREKQRVRHSAKLLFYSPISGQGEGKRGLPAILAWGVGGDTAGISFLWLFFSLLHRIHLGFYIIINAPIDHSNWLAVMAHYSLAVRPFVFKNFKFAVQLLKTEREREAGRKNQGTS